MIRIGICDDEKVCREMIREACEQYFREHPKEYQCVEFSSGEEVLSYTGEKIHLLFLDIEMDGISGVEVMEQIKKNDHVWRIAFVTNHPEQKLETIDLKTLAFLEKPVGGDMIEKCLQIAIRENAENISVPFATIDGMQTIKLDEIFGISADNHYVRILLGQKEITIFDSMKKCTELLQNTTMIRIHKSYLINLRHVKKWYADEVLMTNGEIYPIGRKFRKAAKDQYYTFVKSVTLERDKGA